MYDNKFLLQQRSDTRDVLFIIFLFQKCITQMTTILVKMSSRIHSITMDNGFCHSTSVRDEPITASYFKIFNFISYFSLPLECLDVTLT